MSYAKVHSAQATLLKPYIVDVEADLSRGLNSFSIVGLGDKAVDEAKDRISAAVKNSGFESPKSKNHKVVISLAPAEVKKELFLYSEKYPGLPARWTSKDNLHITLEFLGALTDEEVGEVCIAVKKVAERHESFSLNINKILYGPPLRQGSGRANCRPPSENMTAVLDFGRVAIPCDRLFRGRGRRTRRESAVRRRAVSPPHVGASGPTPP